MIKVLIADDQALIRDGFRMILELDGEIEVVGEAADGASALEEAERTRPDLVLMDIRMPGIDGLEATRRLMARSDPPKVLVLTTYDADVNVLEAMQSGASGFLLKDLRKGQLVRAVRQAAAGDLVIDPAITRRLIDRFVDRDRSKAVARAALSLLTPREAEVLRLIATGLSNAELAEQLSLSESTVKTHVARVLDKLDLRDRVQAVILAYESGLLDA
ncbi:MAG: DNA-binding response regulator [Candidatus Nephthysia bennettiae]|uniref:Response regulator transcription factor n=1 Tax=Candidatus Nephthysia bennettiae TaxID=3127016 RepID=A0A934K7C2_9BACT|nr:response regulator transcription factor [Candidatus Dormibacteraeota bacterium]PZR84997.1 MAG: DNA-binding response regulator [Candidatus Dormibacteraeota bacterium]